MKKLFCTFAILLISSCATAPTAPIPPLEEPIETRFTTGAYAIDKQQAFEILNTVLSQYKNRSEKYTLKELANMSGFSLEIRNTENFTVYKDWYSIVEMPYKLSNGVTRTGVSFQLKTIGFQYEVSRNRWRKRAGPSPSFWDTHRRSVARAEALSGQDAIVDVE